MITVCMPDKVIALVGTERRMIDYDVFISAFEELAERYREQGLSGEELDIAIADALPGKLLLMVGHACKPH